MSIWPGGSYSEPDWHTHANDHYPLFRQSVTAAEAALIASLLRRIKRRRAAEGRRWSASAQQVLDDFEHIVERNRPND